MFNVSTHKIQWKEKEWSLYVPEYCDLAYKVFDIEKLKCFQPLGIKRSLEIIDINGSNYQLLIHWNKSEIFFASLSFSDELFLYQLSSEENLDSAQLRYFDILGKLKNKSTDFPSMYFQTTSEHQLEDLMKSSNLEPDLNDYQNKKEQLLSKVREYKVSLFEKVSDKALYWTAEYEVIRLYLLKFLAILPCLDHDTEGGEVKIILLENLRRLINANHLSEKEDRLPWFLIYAIRASYHIINFIPARILAPVIRQSVKILAKRFIAGVDIQDANNAIEQLKDTGRDITIDQLGELVVSDHEADIYLERVLDIMNGLKQYYPPGERNKAGIFRAHVSIKVSALCSQFVYSDFDYTYKQIAPRLKKILELAAKEQVFINIDAEHYYSRDMIFRVYKKCLAEVLNNGFKCESGIVVQAYLHDCAAHLKEVLESAKELDYKFVIRLVKGAYWDAETLEAQAHNYIPPQFLNKEETDLSFRQIALEILKNSDYLQLTVASHNILDHCWVRSVWEKHFSQTAEIEHQCLHMTYEALSTAMSKLGWPTRNYIPIGDLLVGMAYLVRRIMENSSQVGVLQIMRSHEQSKVLREPQAILREKIIQGDYKSLKDFFNFSDEFRNASPMRSYKDRHLNILKTSYAAQKQAYPMNNENDHLVYSPSDPSFFLGSVEFDSEESVNNKIKACNDAWERKDAWFLQFATRARTLVKLAHLLYINRAKLSAQISYEAGKSVEEALADVDEAIDFIHFYTRETKNYRDHDSIGLIAVIAPWNFPLAIPCGMAIAGVVTGNAVVLKPAEQTPLIIKEFEKYCRQAGIPEDALSFVYGNEKQGKALVESNYVDSIVFTGSKLVGEMLYREQGLKKKNRHFQMKSVVAEMGGKNPILVTNNCELDETVSGVLYSCFAHAGQKCSAASRIIVHKQVKENFLNRFIKACSHLKVGAADDFSTYINPLVSEEDKTRTLSQIQKLKEEVLKVGGKVLLDLSKQDLNGNYIGPVVVEIPSDVALKNGAMFDHEFFAPIIHVTDYETPNEAIELANTTRYALTAGIFCQSQDNIDFYLRNIEAGNIYVNRPNTGARVGIEPFGGFKMSGTGPKAGSKSYLKNFLRPSQPAMDIITNHMASFAQHRIHPIVSSLATQIDISDQNREELSVLVKKFDDYRMGRFPNTFTPNQLSYSRKYQCIRSMDLVVDKLEPSLESLAYLALAIASGARINLYHDSSVRNCWPLNHVLVEKFENKLPEKPSQLHICEQKNYQQDLITDKAFEDFLPRIVFIGEPVFKIKEPNELFDLFIYEKSFAINIMRHGAPLGDKMIKGETRV